MFYKTLSYPQESPQKEFYLLNNFLDKTSIVVDEIATNLMTMTIEEVDKMKTHFSLSDFMKEQFQFLAQAKRDFKIDQVINSKEIYAKLTINGLTGDTLLVKLSALDWLWEKAERLFAFLTQSNHLILRSAGGGKFPR